MDAEEKFWAFESWGHGNPSFFLSATSVEQAKELVIQCIEANSSLDDDWDEPWLTASNLDAFKDSKNYKVTEIKKGVIVVSHND